MSRKLTILDITCRENGFTIKIYADKYNDHVNFEKWEIEKSNEELSNISAINREIHTLIERMNYEPQTADNKILQNLGRDLYNQVFPPEYTDLRKRISQINTPLLICTNAPEICWELLHDGDRFFTDKYSLGRYSQKVEGDPYVLIKKGEKCLIIAGPLKDDPSQTDRNLQELMDSLEDNGMICELLAGFEATREKVLHKISAQEYGIIHYYGHIDFDEQRGPCLRLYCGGKLYSNDIRIAVKGLKFVFLNGCSAAILPENINKQNNEGSEPKNSQKEQPPHDIRSMAHAFLHTGAKVVVGTVADVPTIAASILSRNFYNRIFEGDNVGEALKKARREVKQKGFGATWISYLIYGDPRIRIPISIWEILWKWLRRNLKYFLLNFLIIWLILFLLWPKIIIDGRFDDWYGWYKIPIKKYQDTINDCPIIHGDIIEVRIINDNRHIYFCMIIGGQFAENIFYNIFLGDPDVKNGFNFCRRSNIEYLYLIQRDPDGNIWLFIYTGDDGCTWRWERICLIHESAYSRNGNMAELRLPIEKINGIDVSNLLFLLHTNYPNGDEIDFAPDTWSQGGYKYKFRNTIFWPLYMAFMITLVLLGITVLFKLLHFYLEMPYHKRQLF